MTGTSILTGKVAHVRPLLGIVCVLVLAACGSSGSSADPEGGTAAVAVSGSGVTVDVVTTGNPWQGGFPGAVRIVNTAFASPITSFEVVFSMGSATVTGTPWNGNITGPVSGNYTATGPSWLQYQPIGTGKTWDVGFNGSGTFTSSTIVSVKINGQVIPIGGPTDNPPTVSLASSATTVTTASTVTLTATAADDVGVSRVEFYEGTTLLATDTTAPYTHAIAFTAANNGSHGYTARAVDTAGQTATSSAVTVAVNIGTTDLPPTVSLASSATTVTTASTVTLTATAADDVGVSRVEFYEGTTLLATDTTAPYTLAIAYTAANNGSHGYTARAVDTANQTATSSAVTVSVTIGGTLTTVSINTGGSASGTFQADQYFSGGTTYSRTATIDMSQITTNPPPAAVFNNERYGAFTYTIPGFTAGAPCTVTLYFAEGYVSAAGQRVFSVSINGTTALSNFDIFAAAGGRNRAIARTVNTTANASGQVAIQFIAGVQNPKLDALTVSAAGLLDLPPTVSLASSATNVTSASTITLTATAADDRGVAGVEFYEGSTLLGSDTTAPYTRTVSFTSANNGAHTYTARAIDTANQTATSAGVTVTVNIGTVDNPPAVTLTSSASSVTTAGTITLTAAATDDRGVSKVEFYEGTTLLGTRTTSPITQTVSFTQANNGTHTYTARAYDTANQTANSAPVSVLVNIGGTPGGYELDPPDVCYAQYWNQGCDGANPTCGGRCQTANACSPPENPQKSTFPMTFACPRFIMYSSEMEEAAADDWGANPPFVYGVVGHDADSGGLDTGTSTCCQCYQLVFDTPEPGSAQPPNMPYPKPMIVQSFNTAAGGGKNFDIYMGAGGFGAFNTCVPGTYSGTSTTTFGKFMYTAFPSEYPTTGGIKAINIDECKVNGQVTAASLASAACQNRITTLCNNTASASPGMTATTKDSCIRSNAVDGFYHQNWQVRVKRVECPVALTRVTGCRLAPQGLPQPNPSATTPATADSSFRTGYTTTTMQDCCKPSCAWKDQVTGAGLQAVDKWTSFYSCDQNGNPLTAP